MTSRFSHCSLVLPHFISGYYCVIPTGYFSADIWLSCACVRVCACFAGYYVVFQSFVAFFAFALRNIERNSDTRYCLITFLRRPCFCHLSFHYTSAQYCSTQITYKGIIVNLVLLVTTADIYCRAYCIIYIDLFRQKYCFFVQFLDYYACCKLIVLFLLTEPT